jgi:hypothetical protein
MSSISPIAGNAGWASAIAGDASGAAQISHAATQAAKTVDRDSNHGVSKPETSTARAEDIAAGISTVNIKA